MEKKLYYRAIPETNGKFHIIKEALRGKGKNCFLTEKEAIEHFTNAKIIALEKYEKITEGLQKLKEEFGNFDFGCDVEVDDDSGLWIERFLEIEVNGYTFKFSQDDW